MLRRQIEFVLQLARLEQENFSRVRADHHPFVGHPGVAQVVLRLQLLEGELLQVALAVTEQLEYAVTHDADAGVVVRVE